MADDDKPDSVLDDVKAAYAESVSPPPEPIAPVEPPPEPAGETAGETSARARDEQGRFAKEEKPRETLKAKEKPLVAAKEVQSPNPVASEASPTASQAGPPAAPTAEKVAPPPAWGGLAKVKWDRLPVDVQKEIAQHEAGREQATAELAPLKELFDVNREFLVNQAGSVPNAMAQMMQFARMSVDNPVQLAEHILRARGLDPRAVFAGQPPQAPQAQAPDLQAYVAQLVKQAVQPIMAQTEQQQTQQLESTIQQFAADPRHPFFNDVRVDMGKFIEAGQAKTMEEAYERATWANPTIRAHLIEASREAEGKAKAEQAQKARDATRASVTGSPLPGAQPNGTGGNPRATALDDVREAYRELSGA